MENNCYVRIKSIDEKKRHYVKEILLRWVDEKEAEDILDNLPARIVELETEEARDAKISFMKFGADVDWGRELYSPFY